MDRNLDRLTKTLCHYFNDEPSIISVFVFGSFGSELQTPQSDLDLAILFNKDITIYEELRHTAEISSLLKLEKIDLINLNKAPSYFQHEVLYNGTKIFDRAPKQTQEFIENVLEIFHDYQGILYKYREDLRMGLLEEYFND